MVSMGVELVGFDRPLLSSKLIRRALQRGKTVMKEEIKKTLKQHHDTGQLKESMETKVKEKESLVEGWFKGIRKKDKAKRRHAGWKGKREATEAWEAGDVKKMKSLRRQYGKEYRRWNKTVGFFLNYFKKYYDKNEEKIGNEVCQAFYEETKKAK
jgi:hypothetical protein